MPTQGLISRKEAVLLRPIRRRSLHWAVLMIAIAMLLVWGSHISISSNGDSLTLKQFDDVFTAVRSHSMPSLLADYISEAQESTFPSPYGYDSSKFRSQSRTPLLPCHLPSNSNTETKNAISSAPLILPQSIVRQTIRNYVSSLKNDTNSNSQPSFIPSLHDIMSESIRRNEVMVTVQLGGMDGKAGDPLYEFTRSHDDISLWMPVVMEPVQRNFDELVETYKTHVEEKNLACPHLLHQMANYDAQRQIKTNQTNQDNSKFSQQCPFCHFDLSNPSCQESPDWMKYEVGSMECNVEWKQKCFIPAYFICTSIGDALGGLGLHPRDVAALQIDVEGFEKEILEGYFLEIHEVIKEEKEKGIGETFDSNYYPPVVNFENKVLRNRGQYEDLETWLKEMGYRIFPDKVDTLAIYLGDGTV